MSWLGEGELRIPEQGPARCRICARSAHVRQQASEVAGELGGEGEAIVDGSEPRLWAKNRFRLLVPTPSQFPSQFTPVRLHHLGVSDR